MVCTLVADDGDATPGVSEPVHRFDLLPPPRRHAWATPEGLVLVAAVAVLAAAVATLVTGAAEDTAAAPERAAGSGAAEPAAPAGPAPPPVLLAQQDPSGRASWLTVLVPAAGGRGGTLVFVPPGTMAEVVSLGLEPVGRSLELGGPPRLQATVENLLGAGLGGVTVVDENGLTGLLSPAGPLPVTVPERVEQVSDAGRVEVVFPAGVIELQPGDAGRFLGLRVSANDLARMARHQAFWDAWLGALRQRPDAAPTEPPELGRALSALLAGPVRTRVVPVEGFGSTAEDGELYRVRPGDLAGLVAGVFPAPAVRAGERPRVQILNGTGALGLAEAVRNRLGPGFDVRFTGNAPTLGHAGTQIVYYDPSKQGMAERLRQALGVGTLVFSRRGLAVVDVTVVVGKDFRP